MAAVYRVGADENGLGGQLGPLVVTAVSAEVTEAGARFLSRRLPKRLREDLDDSKALVSSHDTRLGEAWCRVLLEREAGAKIDTPKGLLSQLLLTSEPTLRARCPSQTEAQCWQPRSEGFTAGPSTIQRLTRHLAELEGRGVSLESVRSEVICTSALNANKRSGVHRFMTDLHAMEALLLDQRARAERPILAICGKIGGMGQYGRFFGPLSAELHSVLLEGRAESRYHFPSLGEVRFVRDADAKDPLVMLASLVGKYVRELFMERITSFYPKERALAAPDGHPSGYHDPVTQHFVEATRRVRKRLDVVDDCFLRIREEKAPAGAKPKRSASTVVDSGQGSLF